MKFSLRQIEIFAEVARQQSVAKAAKNLYLSPSAVSESLQNLESLYDLTLFERVRKRLVLTSVGKTLLNEAELLLSHCQSFEAKLSQEQYRGDLCVSSSFTIGNHLATLALSEYLKQFPAAHVNLETGSTPNVIEAVLNRRADIGMIEAEIHHGELELIPWCEDSLVAFTHAQDPRASKRKLSDEDLLNATWILREPESGARQTFDREMRDLLPKLNILLELKHNEAIKNAVASGLGISCLSEIALKKEFEYGLLKPLRINGRDMKRTFYFVMPKSVRPSPALDHWLGCCRAIKS